MKAYIPILVVTAAFLLDLLFGDPRWLYHPVRLIGTMISLLERLTRRIFPATKRGERAAGTLLAVFIILIFTGGSFAAVWFCYHIALPLGLALEVFWCWQLLACRSLQVESMRVFHDLRREEIEDARESLGRIVGRDTDFLDEPSIIRAAVETVAENASDGVVAPMFYMMIGGAAGGFLYKSINTMDSMIGYRNQRYQWFGTTAARLDDLANLIPSRLTALLMIAAAGKPDFDRLQAWKIFLRDRRKHPSPNSAQGESAMAGALGIMLGGDASYFGTLHRKDTLGDPTREPEAGDIALANKLMQRASAAALVLFSAIRILVIIFLLHH